VLLTAPEADLAGLSMREEELDGVIAMPSLQAWLDPESAVRQGFVLALGALADELAGEPLEQVLDLGWRARRRDRPGARTAGPRRALTQAGRRTRRRWS
jgi:hypothetical protein